MTQEVWAGEGKVCPPPVSPGVKMKGMSLIRGEFHPTPYEITQAIYILTYPII
jgi:hypothetical protein